MKHKEEIIIMEIETENESEKWLLNENNQGIKNLNKFTEEMGIFSDDENFNVI